MKLKTLLTAALPIFIGVTVALIVAGRIEKRLLA